LKSHTIDRGSVDGQYHFCEIGAFLERLALYDGKRTFRIKVNIRKGTAHEKAAMSKISNFFGNNDILKTRASIEGMLADIGQLFWKGNSGDKGTGGQSECSNGLDGVHEFDLLDCRSEKGGFRELCDLGWKDHCFKGHAQVKAL
jgi:hypothetical protein